MPHRKIPVGWFVVAQAIFEPYGPFKTRQSLGSPVGMGWEYLAGRDEDKVQGVTTLYRKSYDMVEDARNAAAQEPAETCVSASSARLPCVGIAASIWAT